MLSAKSASGPWLLAPGGGRHGQLRDEFPIAHTNAQTAVQIWV